MFPALYLVRHGHTTLNRGQNSEDRIRGWINVPLDKQGKEEAEELANKLQREVEHYEDAIIITSDLDRASQTAETIANKLKLPIFKTYALRPWNLGDFQGKSSEEAAQQMPKFARDMPSVAVPRGESFNTFKNRYIYELKKMMANVINNKRSIIAVAHYRNEKMAEAYLKGKDGELDLAHFLSHTPDHTGSGIEIYESSPGKWTYKKL